MKTKDNQNVKRTNPYYGILCMILIVLLLNGLIFPKFGRGKLVNTDYGTFINLVDSGKVKEVMIRDRQIYFTAVGEGDVTTTYQTGEINDPKLVDRLLEAESPNSDGKIAFNEIIPQENSPLLNFLLMWVLPGLIFYLIWRQASKSIQARMGNSGNFMILKQPLLMWLDRTRQKKRSLR